MKNKQKIHQLILKYGVNLAVLAALSLGFSAIPAAQAQVLSGVMLSSDQLFSAANSANLTKSSTTSWFNKDEGDVLSSEDIEKASRLDAYFAKREMPFYGYGAKFIETANKYNLDWRLLPAIGVRESSGGKHLMNNNPFGWGSAQIKFSDFDEAIDVVGANLGGYDPDTAKFYKDADTVHKLWHYNGTVLAAYPKQVVAIMGMF